MKHDVKIFIAYHKEDEIVKSKIMTPIHVGAATSDVKLNMQRDDEGDNISPKNDRYCELTGQYWAWKNVEAEYYGFMHYRRHFAFHEIPYSMLSDGVIRFPKIDEMYKNEVGLNDDDILLCAKGYDLVLPHLIDVSNWGMLTNEMQFCSLDNLHAVDFELMCQTVVELYPEYEKTVEEFRQGRYAYWFNMFIMHKSLFRDYSKWLFRILERVEERVDFTGYNKAETRTLAFMAERLFSIYIMKLLRDYPELKIKHLKMTFVNDPEVDNSLPWESETNAFVCSVKKSYSELCRTDHTEQFMRIIQGENKRCIDFITNCELLFYGAGQACKMLLTCFKDMGIDFPHIIWDAKAKPGQKVFGVPVSTPEFESLKDRKDTVVVITITDEAISKEIKNLFLEKGASKVIEKKELLRMLTGKMCVKLASDNNGLQQDCNEICVE